MRVDLSSAEDRLAALALQARGELDALSFATKPWVKPRLRAGRPMLDVAVIGGGQSGLLVTHALMRAGVGNVLMLDRSPAGEEGVWENFARMHEIRSPKEVSGAELGVPSLSIRSWYLARHGRAAWDAIRRVPRLDWAAYLRWYRGVVNPPVWNDASVTDIDFDAEGVTLLVERDGKAQSLAARYVVLATGMDGGGAWHVPPELAAALPRHLYNHTSERIDLPALRGRRIGILGGGAAAFDIAVASLDHGAASADMFMRRPTLPLVDAARELETVGQLQHYPEMADTAKWALADVMNGLSQSPAEHHFYKACAHPDFTLHIGAPWDSVSCEGDTVVVRTPKEQHVFDHVMVATGTRIDMGARPELARIAATTLLWRDRFVPPAANAASARLDFPYLGSDYRFQERTPGAAPGLDRIRAYNVLSSLSLGPMSSVSISSHKYGVPRLVRGLTASLWAKQEQAFIDDIKSYSMPAVTVPARVRAMLGLGDEEGERGQSAA